MKKTLLILLTFIPIIIKAQSDSTWKIILVNPDLKIEFPLLPVKTINSDKELYSLRINNYQLEINSKKSPLIYYGRTIKEVNDEYYGYLTQNTLTEGGRNRKLITERDFKLDGFRVKELIFNDTVDNQQAKVKLWILNVVGFKEACYNISFVDFEQADKLPEIGQKFFKSIDVYYKMEKQITDNPNNEDSIFKEEGFKIDKKSKKRK